jgi:hypothetical protein
MSAATDIRPMPEIRSSPDGRFGVSVRVHADASAIEAMDAYSVQIQATG